MTRSGEAGYAMVAAVAAMAVLATASLTLLDATRSGTAMVAAERGQAQAAAATEAGLAIALDGLLVRDRAGRWSIDGRDRATTYDGMRLDIRVEDERGKVVLNRLDAQSVGRFVEAAGLSGERARIAAASLIDWTDEDDDPRENGAEREHYQRLGQRIRNGPLQSIDELAQVRGFDAATVERVRPFVTLSYGAGGFDARYAHPAAIEVMLGTGGGIAAITRAREQQGQRTAIELGDDIDLAGRPLTVAVTASGAGGVRYQRRWLIELTGSDARPYVIRSVG